MYPTAGLGQDPADNLPAGIPARVQGHFRSPYGHRAQVYSAQLDQRVQKVVPSAAGCQVSRDPRTAGERFCPDHAQFIDLTHDLCAREITTTQRTGYVALRRGHKTFGVSKA